MAAAELTLPRVSQRATVSQTVGFTDVTITYGRPSVHGRRIWGELIPYGIVWRTGANEATTIAFSKDVTIDRHVLPAGTYSMQTILSKAHWTLIFNKVSKQWGSFEYDPAQDALRIEVTPTPCPFTELLTFSIPRATAISADVVLQWERMSVRFTFETDTAAKVLTNARAAIASAAAEDWTTPLRAAEWAFDNDVAPAEARDWVDRSIAVRETYANLELKAKMLAKTGNTREAVSVARRAIAAARAAEPKVDPAELEKMVAVWEKFKS